ncbi:hypothetical protein BT93_L4783 [Corymbia citriodora subsp. variegata]|uniref:Protein BCCIP homolog n=1 Tax=Corymbia citriodora subsp. variegata TaxID=360336 RepID=A0A8T0CFP8_CORYI|nr:hypothetical protein BT93_L4783 [Corymbia citriodora subsp. variegata]
MPKRKSLSGDNAMDGVDDADDSGEDFDVVDVDFEWFDPDSEIDFEGIKSLLKQLFDLDAHQFDLSALTDLILGQPLLGSTVKVDGKETDAYAFLSVLNLREHKDKPCIMNLVQYLQARANSNPSLSGLSKVLSDPSATVGLILTERLINCPIEVIPPMYTMLQEEIQWALEQNEPYQFSHYVVLSKTYTEVNSKLDEEDSGPSSKKKKKANGAAAVVFPFHEEDEILQQYSLCHGGYDYITPADDGASDSKRAFQEAGIRPRSHAILLEAGRLAVATSRMAQTFAAD